MTYAIFFVSHSFVTELSYQGLFVPAHRLDGTTVAPRLYYRSLGKGGPTTATLWEVALNEDYTYSPESMNIEKRIHREISQLNSLSPYFLSILGDPSNTLLGSSPILVTPAASLKLLTYPNAVPAELLTQAQDALARIREATNALGVL